MAETEYANEIERALARSDADKLCRQIDAYAAHHASGESEWPENLSEDFSEIVACYDDPEKALAYVVLGISRIEDVSFLGFLGCGPLEDILDDPSPELLERIVAEAHRSPRFRWLLSCPFKAAISEKAWEAIHEFRITGPHEEPADDTMPPR